MRRNNRNSSHEDNMNDKIIKYSGIALVILTIIVFGILMYSRNLNNQVKKGSLTSKQISSIMNNSNENKDTEATALEIGKTVEESKSEISNNTTNKVENQSNEVSGNSTSTSTSVNNNKTTNNTKESEPENNKVQEEVEITLDFDMPVEGDITKDFASENLIYSETLQEWTTHMGIDIKADKTSVVKAAEAGKIKSIKNDPRFGLTVVIEHANGMQSIYSNLLTAEFIVEGENVEKGQAIGTVGNTAAFEIADEPHLHFEMLKDSIYVDPNIYLK